MSPPVPAPAPTRAQLARLRQIWRSGGWPCHDDLELDALAAGWAQLRVDDQGRETVHLTEAGRDLLAARRRLQRRALGAHDRLAERMARHLHEAGRLVWRELSLRAPVPLPAPAAADGAPANVNGAPATPPLPWDETPPPHVEPTAALAPAPADAAPPHTWRLARADVFSVRHTTVEAWLHPVVHEIKTSRADLLSDLRHEAKRLAYQGLCCECHYVFPAGVADPAELPDGLGVWLLRGDVDGGTLELARPARHLPCRLPFGAWMALARATPWSPPDDGPGEDDDGPRQRTLGAPPP